MRKLVSPSTFVLISLSLALAQHVPKTSGKPTEAVIKKYEQFVAEGAFLTEGGWNKAMKLFAKPTAYPTGGNIELVSTGGLIGEDWVKGSQAQVETKWTDTFGNIDSKLRYTAPYPGGESMGVLEQWLLVRVIDTQSGKQEWKIDGTPKRAATLERAIVYVTTVRDQTTDPVTRKNAEKTIKILQQMKGCSVNRAC